MMWPTREATRRRLMLTMRRYSSGKRHLPGIDDARALDTLATQIVASLRREDYYRAVRARKVEATRADPNDLAFDAERAVAFHVQAGNVDEAAWLAFLMTHLGRPNDTGWLRLRDLYGRMGAGIWDWPTVSADPAAFAAWLETNWHLVRGKFGNHRKYESLRPNSARNMGRVVADYVRWISGADHSAFIADVIARAGNDPFDAFYRSMAVTSFGRLAKFDYLMMLGRYGIAVIAPASAYLGGATGPRAGARLLFAGSCDAALTANELQTFLDDLDADLGVGMAVLEDALCNWQKQPLRFVHFTG